MQEVLIIRQVAFREIGRSQFSFDDWPELLAFRSVKDWSRHRALAHGVPDPLASLDWSAQMLVEVALGVRGSAGFSVRVVAVEDDGGGLRVRAVEDPPGPESVVARVETQPSVYIITAAHDGPIALELVESGLRPPHKSPPRNNVNQSFTTRARNVSRSVISGGSGLSGATLASVMWGRWVLWWVS